MKRTLFLCVIWAVIAAFAVVIYVVKNNALSVEQVQTESKTVKANRTFLQELQDARVIAFNSWPVQDREDRNLFYSVQAFDQDPNHEGPGVKMSIFNQAGALLFENYFTEVQNIYPSHALRKSTPQMVMEVGYGGGASFLKILDYQDGKIIDLMDTVKPNNDFTISAEVRPQLRTGVNLAVEPYEVLLTEGIGLASPAEKYTKVFRYRDGAYRYAGEFSAQKVDDYIEKLLTESRSNNEKSIKP